MLLHWVLGFALIGLFGVGIYMTGLPFSPQRLKLYNWHKWAGVTILVLSVLRLLWRATHRPPALPPAIENAMPGWQKLAHHATHGLLYTLFFAVPLIGWAYSSAAGFPVVWFGVIELPVLIDKDPGLKDLFKTLHELSAKGLVFLVAGHVLMALKHHFMDKDRVLGRMIPGAKVD
mgnify:CR=1 FL=1